MPNFQDTLRNAAFEPLSSDPAAPTGGAARFYYNTTSDTLRVYDGTQWTDVGSAGGSGEINYVSNPSAKSAITGWTASGAGITVARTTTGSELPRESLSPYGIKITPVSGTTDYVYTRFTMGDADKGKLLKIQWAQKSLSGYASGDLVVEMWTNAASNYGGSYTQIPVAVSTIAGGDYVMLTTFASSTADYYEMRIRRAAGTTAIVLGDVVVGPGSAVSGVPVVSDWVLDNSLITASAGFGTIANKSIYKKRVGDSLQIVGYFTAGTVAGSVAYLSISGLTIDASKLPKSGGSLSVAEVGQFVVLQSGGVAAIYSGDYAGKLFVDSDAASQEIRFTTVVGADEYADQNATSIIGSGVGAYINLTVPISEYASGGVFIDTSAVEYAASTNGTWDDSGTSADTVYGVEGAPITGLLTAQRNKEVLLRTSILPTDIFAVQYKIDNAWVNAENSLYPPTVHGSGVNFGMVITNVDTITKVVTVSAYQYISPGATYNGTGVAYDGTFPQPTAWRIIKSSNPIGIGQSTPTTTYSVPVDKFEVASLTYEDAAVSSPLPAGTYLVNYHLMIDNSVGAGIGSPYGFEIVLDTVSGNATSTPNQATEFCARTAMNGAGASVYYPLALSAIVKSNGVNLTINNQSFTGNILYGKSYVATVVGAGTKVSGAMVITKLSTSVV